MDEPAYSVHRMWKIFQQGMLGRFQVGLGSSSRLVLGFSSSTLGNAHRLMMHNPRSICRKALEVFDGSVKCRAAGLPIGSPFGMAFLHLVALLPLAALVA